MRKAIAVLWLVVGAAIIVYTALEMFTLLEAGYQKMLSGKLLIAFGLALIAAALALAAGIGLLVVPIMKRLVRVSAIAFALYAFIYLIGWNEGHWAVRVAFPIGIIAFSSFTLYSTRSQH